jgi:hypothetical protein
MATRTDRAEPTAQPPRRWLRLTGLLVAGLLLGLAAFLGLRALSRDSAATAAAPRTVAPAKAPPVTSPRPPAPAPGRAERSPDAGDAAAVERARAILKGAEELLREGQDAAQGNKREEEKQGRGKGHGKKKKKPGERE